MSYAPGAGLDVNLAYSLSALVAFAFLVLPGFGVAWGLGRRARWSLAEMTGAAFALEMAVVGVVALVAHYAGGSLTFVLAASAVVFVALTLAGVLLARPRAAEGERERVALGAAGLVLGALGAVLAVVQRPWFALTADTFYHLAAVRSLLVSGRPMVTDPFYNTGIATLDPTSGVWQTQLALISKATGLDPAWVWPGATAVGAAMTLLAFWLLAKVVSRSEWAAAAATIAFLLFPLQLDMRWFAYPNRMSLAVIFLAVGAVAGLMERPRLADAVLLVAAGFSAMSLHMASAAVIVIASVFLGLLLVAAVVVERVRDGVWEWRPVAALAATGLVLALVSAGMVLPKSDVVKASPLVTYQAAEIAKQTKTIAGGAWVIARPALFRDDGSVLLFATLIGVAAAVPAFAKKDRRALAACGICVLPAALLLDPPVATLMLRSSLYLTSRIAILLRFPMYVGIAWGLAGLQGLRTRSWARWAGAAAAVAAVVVAGVIVVEPYRMLFSTDRALTSSFSSSRRTDVRDIWGPSALAKVAAALGDGYPTVAGDLETTYYLAGIVPVSVVAAPPKHAPFAIEAIDGEQRRRDMETLMDAHTPERIRREILTRRRVSFILVPPHKKGMYETLQQLRRETGLVEPVVDTKSLVLFRVKASG